MMLESTTFGVFFWSVKRTRTHSHILEEELRLRELQDAVEKDYTTWECITYKLNL